MGANTSQINDLSNNPNLKTLVGTESISENDPFWNQLISFTFISPTSRYELTYMQSFYKKLYFSPFILQHQQHFEIIKSMSLKIYHQSLLELLILAVSQFVYLQGNRLKCTLMFVLERCTSVHYIKRCFRQTFTRHFSTSI